MTWIACPRRHRESLRRRAPATGALLPLSWLPPRARRRPASLTPPAGASAGGPMTLPPAPPAPPCPCPLRAFRSLDRYIWTGRGAAGAACRRAQGWLGTAPSPVAVVTPLRCARAAAPRRTPRTLLPSLALLHAPARRTNARRQVAKRGGRVPSRHLAGPCTLPPRTGDAKDAATACGPRRLVCIGRGTGLAAGMAPVAVATVPAHRSLPPHRRGRMRDCGGLPRTPHSAPPMPSPPPRPRPAGAARRMHYGGRIEP